MFDFLFHSRKLIFYIILVTLLSTSCATYTLKYKNDTWNTQFPRKTKAHSFYLIGDAGNASMKGSTKALIAIKKVLDTVSTKNNHVIFLGDNIYPSGMPKKNTPERALSEHRIHTQTDVVKNFKGKTLFIPGNHDWYTDGVQGVRREERYIEKRLASKTSFSPSKGCPIASISINNTTHLLAIDSQWYLADWDENPTINDNCEIKTRALFIQEIASEFKKHGDKTIIVAMHHPLFTNGPHGGKFSFQKHLFPLKKKIPLPFLGSLVAQVRAQGGISPQDISNHQFIALKKRLITMAKDVERIVFVSGHEHSLQYLNADGIRQIVSGSGANISASTLGKDGIFTFPGQGFAVLDIHTDGSSIVRFYGIKNKSLQLVYQTPIHTERKEAQSILPMIAKKEAMISSPYTPYEVQKSSFYKTFWGSHYRYVYGTPIQAPVATLDTLWGGFRIDRKGGGQQTRSLRLIDTLGKRYSLRAVRKSATQFLQKGAFVNTYLDGSFNETFTERLLLDFYTASHPYGTFAIGPLADAIGVYHANPKLYYIPKHTALGNYNTTYGNELYVLEERPGKEFHTVSSFGNPDDIESTPDMLSNLRKDEKYQVDEGVFIKARLFDMILGDWDRHPDQWRWARFDSKNKKLYRPIPRDRDQAFSNYDGRLISIAKFIVPLARKFQVYNAKLKNVRWINESGIKLDRAFITRSNKEDWLHQAKYIKTNLTDEIIDDAFTQLPIEIQDHTINTVKSYLKKRRDAIIDIASRYYDYFSKQVSIRGTDKDDFFEIIRSDSQTQVKISRVKNGKVQPPYYNRILYSKNTKEIWIYGLDDDDMFKVYGKGKHPIKIRIIGGQNNDTYALENGKKIRLYDHKTKPNTIRQIGKASTRWNNNYNQNLYDYTKYTHATNTFIPLIGFNPDDGFNVNLTYTHLYKGFFQDPYQTKHSFRGAYYVATRGYDLSYIGAFKNTISNWDLELAAAFTSENFAQNFFGFGNDTQNFDSLLDMDYNRVKISTRSVDIGISHIGFYKDKVGFYTTFETHRVDDTPNRFIVNTTTTDTDFFKRKYFAGSTLKYRYESYDLKINPTQGMIFDLNTGLKVNLDQTERTHGFVNTELGFYNAITRNKKLVLKTHAIAQHRIGNTFEFYQGATLGGVIGLRGYRNERFIGRSALAFSSDLRYSFNAIKTGVLPIQFGVYLGGDVGRVWYGNSTDNRIWHNDLGGGIWLNIVNAVMGQLGVFSSKEDTRFTFQFGVDF